MQATIDNTIKFDKRVFKLARNNAVKSAEAVSLLYVCDTEPGYTRKRSGKNFTYYDGDKKVSDLKCLDRFKELVIPPAWTSVWICKSANGHLQVTGFDKLNRKQYRYHPKWNTLRNLTKFFSLLDFGKQLPAIRTQLKNDLSLSGFPQQKILATVVSLLDRTSIRVGNSIYEKLYGSFGLTTLKNKHASVNGAKVTFSFTGKKGIRHNITLRNKKLSRIIKGCQEIPGKKLFEYYDEQGMVHCIDSGMVNAYIQQITNQTFTAKDFRTWAGSVHSLLAFKQLGDYENEADKKQKVNAALDCVAQQLGNTRTVCRKYYVHPEIISLFEEKKLMKHITDLSESNADDDSFELQPEEKLLLKLISKS